MPKSSKNREAANEVHSGQDFLGHDMAISIAEALLNSDDHTVAAIDAALPEDPTDRRERQIIHDVVSRSVFGQAEPATAIAQAPRRGVFLGSSNSAAIASTAEAEATSVGQAADRPQRIVIKRPVAHRVVVPPTPARGGGTAVLALLFLLALSGSVALTFAENQSDASVVDDIDPTDPTVRGVTTLVASGEIGFEEPPVVVASTSTSLATSTVPTTAPTTATTVPTTATTVPTTATTQPPTTQTPTTQVRTTRRPTTQRPATTARPVTTQLTIPDVTFSAPTWVGGADAP